jgi:hypothetical protein
MVKHHLACIYAQPIGGHALAGVTDHLTCSRLIYVGYTIGTLLYWFLRLIG